MSDPGRGVIWIERAFAGIEIRNNQIIARTTSTPRTEGLFGFHGKTDFSTHVFRDNIIECIGQARPLFRNDESGQAKIENNVLTNVSDTARYENPKTEARAGLVAPLKFACGVNGEPKVDGWKTSR